MSISHGVKSLLLAIPIMLSSCGKQYKAQIAAKDAQITQLQDQLDNIQNTNSSLLDRLSDMSVINKAGSESIQESLQSINRQSGFIQDLTTKVQEKDSINLALVMNLKRSLNSIAENDLQVEVRGGKVHVSISDRLMFRSGSSNLSNQAQEVLGKLALVINDHDELQILVEGHTDNVPHQNECDKDNWDLSVSRATSVVRALHESHYVAPERMTAAGRAFYLPKGDNDSEMGRRTNRRTEIIIMPRLDQFFELMEMPDGPG